MQYYYPQQNKVFIIVQPFRLTEIINLQNSLKIYTREKFDYERKKKQHQNTQFLYRSSRNKKKKKTSTNTFSLYVIGLSNI